MPKMSMYCVKHRVKHSVEAKLGKVGSRNAYRAKCPTSSTKMIMFAKG